MDRIELWTRREREAGDYDKCKALQEKKWLESNADMNAACLRTMRGLMPANLAHLTVPAFIKAASDADGCFTYPLVEELRGNKLLQWCVAAPEEIARCSFLMGPYASCFESYDGLDIVESRALAAVLSAVPSFDLDKDGRKAAWRSAFLQRVQRLAAQEARENAKSGQWDNAMQRRATRPLPPLTPDQQRRRVYFYKPYPEMLKSLTSYRAKLNSLASRRAALAAAETAYTEAKGEYATILAESREPAMKALYGDVLKIAKQTAKDALIECESTRRRLVGEIKTVEAAIAAAPVTMEEYRQHMEHVGAYLQARGVAWGAGGGDGEGSNMLIEGCFDEFPELGCAAGADSASSASAGEDGSSVSAASSAHMAPQAGYDCASSIAARNRELEALRCHSPMPHARQQAAVFESLHSQNGDGQADASQADASQASQCLSLTPPRRVLQSVRPEVVSALEGMFRGQGTGASSSSSSVVSTAHPGQSLVSPPGSGANENAQQPINAAPVESRSKTLLKLLGVADAGSGKVVEKVKKPALSFLEQIKASKMRKAEE